ncbi:LPXTG-domain-containing protein cell wall anchor domain, partial [Eggerthia catenaformis OT 569 = DSM 20559]
EKVEGYETKVEGYNIKNTHTLEKTELKVTKTWDDENDKDKIRPASITVRLYANGKEKESIVLDKSNGWTYAWKNLDKYENGKEIRYTVTEDKVKGYESEIDSSNAKDIKIKNTHKPEKPKTPDTGDHSDIMMQMIMMMGSLLGIALITRKKIKA